MENQYNQYFIPTQYAVFRNDTTIFVKNKDAVPLNLQKRFDACEGEIFLHNIPVDLELSILVRILLKVEPIYILRFKITFGGTPRRFAYLQYMNPNRRWHALRWLPTYFEDHKLKILCVNSTNCNTLLLKNVDTRITPIDVYNFLRSFLQFKKLRIIEYKPNVFHHHIIFDNFENACNGRRMCFNNKHLFGSRAYISMLDMESFEMFRCSAYHCAKITSMDLQQGNVSLNKCFNCSYY